MRLDKRIKALAGDDRQCPFRTDASVARNQSRKLMVGPLASERQGLYEPA
jgi:hypothetical protein